MKPFKKSKNPNSNPDHFCACCGEPIFRGDPKFLRNDPKGLFAWVETKTVVWVFVSQKAKRAFLGVK
jgi:hypothetical protein